MGEGLGSGTPDDHSQILKENRHSDGSDQGGQTRRLPQRPIGKNVQQYTTNCATGHGKGKGGIKRESQDTDKCNGEKGTQHVDFAVSKINKLDNTVNHGVSHRDHGIYATDGESVDKLL